MKKRMYLLCILSLCLSVFFCFVWQWADTDENISSKMGEPAGNTMGETKEEKEKYYLQISGDTICAYKLSDNEKTLLRKSSISLENLPESELALLKEGIYAGSYEELCLYLEAYIS